MATASLCSRKCPTSNWRMSAECLCGIGLASGSALNALGHARGDERALVIAVVVHDERMTVQLNAGIAP
jgi:hypothetical protein